MRFQHTKNFNHPFVQDKLTRFLIGKFILAFYLWLHCIVAQKKPTNNPMPPRKTSRLRNRRQAPREKLLSEHTAMQMALSSRVLELVDAPPGREQEVDFFFYADNRSAARSLATALKEMEYDVSVHSQPGGVPRFFVGGMTKKMRMDDQTLQLWTEKMCGLAARYDCEFDGWGTMADIEDGGEEGQ